MPSYPSVSETASSLSENVYSGLAARAKEMPGPVYPLHVGDTYREPVLAARAEAQLSGEHARLHNYAPVQGESALLKAIQQRLVVRGGPIESSCLQIMSGATAGLSVVSQALLEPGDEVILPSPYWPLIRGIIAARGAKAVEVPFWTRLGEPNFEPVAALESALSPRTAALYINTPNNPTGQLLPDEILSGVVQLVRSRKLWLFCDEAYEDLYFDERPLTLWTRPELREQAVVCHTFSKSYGLAGARVGYTHGSAAAMKAIRGMQTFTTYCAPRPMQFAALAALNHGAEWLDETRQVYRQSAELVASALDVPRPRSGTFVFFDAAPYFRRGEDLLGFLERCLDAGVLLTPGAACGRDFSTWVRLCFTAVPPDELEQALGRLRGALK